MLVFGRTITKQTTYFVVCLLLLQGCLLNRLEKSRQQLCDNQIVLSLEGGISVIFSQPTLYDMDIQKILGEKPSREYVHGNYLFYEYLVTRKGDDISGIFDIPVRFQFIRENNRNRLVKANINKNIEGILSSDLLKQLFRSGCDAKLKGNTVEVDLAGVDLAKLPKIEKIKTILGKPHDNNEDKYTYYYKLNSSDTAEIIISYDDKIDRMSAVRIIYFRYVLEVDFTKHMARGKIKNLSNMVGLGFWVALSP